MPGTQKPARTAGRCSTSVLAVTLAAAALASCGGAGEDEGSEVLTLDQEQRAAADPSLDDFPKTRGRTLEQVANEVRPGLRFAPAGASYVPGENRVGFGLLGNDNEFVYAPTAVYVARTPQSPASGPFLAPTDSLVTEPEFRSQSAALESDPIASVYAADVPLPKAGSYAVLVVSAFDQQLLGATAFVEVAGKSPIPVLGEPAPRVETDTLEDSSGQIANIDTRQPPDDMHSASFADVVGERPVALLFATPQLCESRVCGPVTDIALQLKAEYGDEVEFIHQEVYVDNEVEKGLRRPLREFGLPSEPWLFTVDADGRIAARLEGSFGVTAFETAVQEAIE